ncbi:MAG: uroporphyrinogen decarboxylase [Deltaproteobacteria bacterium]|nr:uroporphyrinogen decarboxylase [Deltaproteobacteria bacterium]
MTGMEKQDAFLEKWASGEGIPFVSDEAKAAYKYRATLVKDALSLKKSPDRVPVLPIVTFAPAMMGGISGKQAMYDADAAGKCYLDFALKYAPDGSGSPHLLSYGPALDALDYNLYKWPGHGVADDLSYQFVEKEYMKAEEFDDLIADPTDFLLRKWMPRTAGNLKGLSQMASVFNTIHLAFTAPFLVSLGAPDMQKALYALAEAGKTTFEWFQKLMPYMGQILAEGFPFYSGGATCAPFDVLSDSLRGTTQLMMDVYRRPEKVLEAMERLVPIMVNWGANDAIANNNPLVFIPLHKGADGFMSNEQFEKFYWPTLDAVNHGLAERGCIPCLFVEGGYNQRLEFLLSASDIRIFYLFDRTDMKKAREILGGKVCIGGGYSISQILTGDVQSATDEAKRLLDDAMGDGGFIMSVGCAMDEGKEDTFRAMIETTKEYGKY